MPDQVGHDVLEAPDVPERQVSITSVQRERTNKVLKTDNKSTDRLFGHPPHIITDEPLPGNDATRRLFRRPPATSRRHSPAHVIPGLTGNPEGNGWDGDPGMDADPMRVPLRGPSSPAGDFAYEKAPTESCRGFS